MMRDYLLAAGLVLATASQLRMGGLPVGPGEICLALWIVLTIGGQTIGPRRPTRTFWEVMTFWAVFVIAQCFGTIWGVASRVQYDWGLFFHDVLTYALLAPISCLLVMNDDAGIRLRRTSHCFVAVGTVYLGIQLLQALGGISIPLIDPWFWERFRGWSSNPNQLGLFCAILGLFALYLAEAATNRMARVSAVTCLVLPIVVGRMTGSDTFTLVLLATGPIFLAMKLWSWSKLRGRRQSVHVAIIQLLVMTLPIFLIATAPLAMSLASHHDSLSISLAKNNGKDEAQEADLRLFLWHQALEKGFETGMLGLGPGPHLSIPASIMIGRSEETNQPDDVTHPTQGAAPNFEAHNTLLDLFTQGGLIAVLAFLWLHAKAFLAACRARSAGSMALLAGLCIFGMTGLVIRHPMYWFALSVCLWGQGTSRQASAIAISMPCDL